MKHFVQHLHLQTDSPMQFFDITDQVREVLKGSAIKNGLATVFTHHTTTSIVINEKETGLQKDMSLFLSAMAPVDGDYLHDREPVDDRRNAHSHLQSLLLSTSQVIPVVDGALLLGSWQSVFFVELDGARLQRQVTIQVMGD